MGTVLVALVTVGIFTENRSVSDFNPIRVVGFGAAGLLMFALLVYTLFFALPFEATYLEDNRKRLAYTREYMHCAGIPEFYGMQGCICVLREFCGQRKRCWKGFF